MTIRRKIAEVTGEKTRLERLASRDGRRKSREKKNSRGRRRKVQTRETRDYRGKKKSRETAAERRRELRGRDETRVRV